MDINNIPELKQSSVGYNGVTLGASISISMAIDLLQKASELDGYRYAGQMATHMKRVANVPVRNVCCMNMACCITVCFVGNKLFFWNVLLQ